MTPTHVFMERSRASRGVSKGGPRTWCGFPCFETAASQPPQHEVYVENRRVIYSISSAKRLMMRVGLAVACAGTPASNGSYQMPHMPSACGATTSHS